MPRAGHQARRAGRFPIANPRKQNFGIGCWRENIIVLAQNWLNPAIRQIAADDELPHAAGRPGWRSRSTIRPTPSGQRIDAGQFELGLDPCHQRPGVFPAPCAGC